MNYQETLEYLYVRLPVFHQTGAQAYKPGLNNTVQLLEGLQNPQNQFKSIHIAGTNGKGSVSHFLAAIFQSAGYKTGLYTSPHLVDFGERIRINGKMIDPDFVVQFTQDNLTLFDTIQPSFFEATMAMAFQYFDKKKVDIAIIETGLGGRLDSTNIIQPLLSVITNISLDHTAFLGNTLHEIAFEKAGIIKPGIPAVIGEWNDETRAVFESRAKETQSALNFADKHYFDYQIVDNKLRVIFADGSTVVPELQGEYQIKNIATVLQSIDVFRQYHSDNFSGLNQNALVNGIENVCTLTGLRGRWESLGTQPLIVTDTGHNLAGIRYVVKQLQNQHFQNLHIVFGMVNDKDIRSVLDELPKQAFYYFTNASVQRALPAADLKTIAESRGLHGTSVPGVATAIQSALKKATKEDMVFIGGSNFVVGEAISYFENSDR